MLIEEDLKQDYKNEITKNAIDFNKENIQTIFDKHLESQGFQCEVTDREEGEFVQMNVVITVKKSRLDNKRELIKDVQQTLSNAIKPHILVNSNKRPHPIS